MDKTVLREEVKKFLDEHVTAAMATVSPEGEPQVATLYYDIDRDLNFYFITAQNSKKLKNIESNKNVAITVGFGPEPVTVQIGGIAEIGSELKDEVVERIFKKIDFHHLDQWPVLQLEKGGLVVLKVKPKWLVFLNLDQSGHPTTYSHHFHQLIP